MMLISKLLSETLKKGFAEWNRDESGSQSVEFILMVPFLAWATLGPLTYFDAYRNESISFRANQTIADMFSREDDYITPEYMEGAHGLLEFLATDDEDPDLRVTAFRWIEDEDKYEMIWSEERGPRETLDDQELADFSDRLPVMADGDMALLVETWIEYEAPWDMGIDDFVLSTFTVISPRFTIQLCWNNTPEAGAATAIC